MTADTLNELRDELEHLRRRTRLEIAERLREARAYGDGSNNDEHHATDASPRMASRSSAPRC
jgi:transcription elongation GreA/GreB family factor